MDDKEVDKTDELALEKTNENVIHIFDENTEDKLGAIEKIEDNNALLSTTDSDKKPQCEIS